MIKHTLKVSIAIGKVLNALNQDGYYVQCSSNFKKLGKVVSRLKGKKLSPQFRLNFFDLHAENAFWIGIYDFNRKCVSIHASRIEELGTRTLAEHWNDQQKRIYPKPNLIGKKHAPLANEITGRVAYNGDFWVHKRLRGTRDIGNMVFLGFLLCQQYKDPDWIYGLMSTSLVKRGFLNLCGFDHGQPYGTAWELEPSNIFQSDWLVATKREGVFHRANIIAKHGLKQFQKEQKLNSFLRFLD